MEQIYIYNWSKFNQVWIIAAKLFWIDEAWDMIQISIQYAVSLFFWLWNWCALCSVWLGSLVVICCCEKLADPLWWSALCGVVWSAGWRVVFRFTCQGPSRLPVFKITMCRSEIESSRIVALCWTSKKIYQEKKTKKKR